MRRVLINAAICFVILGAIHYLHYFRPDGYIYLVVEDSWVEYGTFSCFLAAAMLTLLTGLADRRFLKAGYLLLGWGLFFISMEEISWGQRLLNIGAPRFVTRFNYQSEMTLHNMVPGRINLTLILSLIILVGTLVLPLLAWRMTKLRQLTERWGLPLVPGHTMPYFIAALYTLLFQPLVKSDEIGELLLGLAFLLFAGGILIKALKSASPRGTARRVIWYTSLAVAGLTSFLVFVRPSHDSISANIHWAAVKGYPKYGLLSQAERVFLYLLDHEELKTEDTLYQYSMLLGTMNSPKAGEVLKRALDEQYRIIEMKPDEPKPRRAAGVILKLLGYPDEAQAEFQKALELNDRRLEEITTEDGKFSSLMSLGETHFAMGSREAALGRFEQALAEASDGSKQAFARGWIRKTKEGF